MIAADVLPSCIARSLAAVLVAMHEKCITFFHMEVFQLPVPLQS